MPAVKRPCLQCKGDEERPKCRRCVSKQLPCSRPAKKTVFKHGSVASFSKDQKWVNSEAKHFRFHPRGGTAAREPSSPGLATSHISSTSTDPVAAAERSGDDTRSSWASQASHSPMDTGYDRAETYERFGFAPSLLQSDSFNSDAAHDTQPAAVPPAMPSISYLTSSASHFSPRLYDRRTESQSTSPPHNYPHESPSIPTSRVPVPQPLDDGRRRFPLQNVQEACLLRYFIEEISHWFDLCDENRHFQLVVPVRAQKHPHLLDAIFAVAARHLSRLPQYKTAQGILYHGQLLPDLHEHAAVEYMLKCIPALRQFHDVQDDEYRDSIITTAVILRQLEEIDHEDDAPEHPMEKPVNFLAIIDAVLRSLPSQAVFGQRSLMQAAYWMALRQEIFNSFTRREAPQLMLPPEFWHSASRANKVVMHLVQISKWHWGDGSEQEWMRLMKQQEHVEQDVLVPFQPIYQKPADKTKGEIFPTIWYGSNIEVTSVQLGLIAKSVLVAEKPFLRDQSTSRSSWRQVENEVRILLLELCGIALCNPASPPALVQAAIGIGMYGDYFTDQYERQAIRTVVERYRDTHAWPVQRLLQMFQ
ncbi:Uncharacterized protein TPAR_07581 [Tolypocladium paradoxum]|uniref:Zn(2)-C6 fungal-type domain-containing protein n=1 Tax=Tolypocladium paradoxum TaxID=94208 RepID=A0A2S4KPZ2_9HYPO|nr:Uncharacterized protein TPAR_07581 [Tolypocladium paradoxum]